MILLALTGLLYVIVGLLLWIAARRKDGTARKAIVFTLQDFMHLLPRLIVGVVGAGFLARLLPQEAVLATLGPDSGLRGILTASIAGALTPGGPVVGFALGAAALKSGAGFPQIIAYVTAWSLFALNRTLVWELPFMPAWFVKLRILVALPIPLIVAGLVMAAG